MIAEVDSGIHPQQETIIRFALNTFGIEMHNKSQDDSVGFEGIKDYYEILECKESDSMETIKKNYKRLLKEYHPDRYIHKDLPQDFINLANKKTTVIHEAYKSVMKERKKASV